MDSASEKRKKTGGRTAVGVRSAHILKEGKKTEEEGDNCKKKGTVHKPTCRRGKRATESISFTSGGGRGTCRMGVG